jgi:NhaA family Na+:H+ antiporter
MSPKPDKPSPIRRIGKRARSAIAEFARLEAAGGIVLLAAAILALIWANSPWSEAYASFKRWPLGFRVFGTGIEMPLVLWVNDGLMALFFLVVGLEIKRELTSGELSSVRTAALPAVAALGGIVAPALLFLGINSGLDSARGWGIPIATDIAFSLGVLSLLGKRVPTELKVFLTALAIVDDIGALAVIAFVYSTSLDVAALGWAALLVLALVALVRRGIVNVWVFVVFGIGLWLLFLRSGVHATIAGVVLAFCIPATARDGSENEGFLERAEHALLPWTTFAIVPLFGLINAGVALDLGAARSLGQPLAMGVLVGLVVGKPVGILAASWLAVKWKAAALPTGVTWRQLTGVGCLAGIGFTMSVFVAELAFENEKLVDSAKIGILVASLVSALLGAAVLNTGAHAQDKRSDPGASSALSS